MHVVVCLITRYASSEKSVRCRHLVNATEINATHQMAMMRTRTMTAICTIRLLQTPALLSTLQSSQCSHDVPLRLYLSPRWWWCWWWWWPWWWPQREHWSRRRCRLSPSLTSLAEFGVGLVPFALFLSSGLCIRNLGLHHCSQQKCPGKIRDRQYFGHNFDRFKYIVVIFCKEYHKGNVKLLTQWKSTSPNHCRYFTLQLDNSHVLQSGVCQLARLLKNACIGFGWNVACRQMSGHGRTD